MRIVGVAKTTKYHQAGGESGSGFDDGYKLRAYESAALPNSRPRLAACNIDGGVRSRTSRVAD